MDKPKPVKRIRRPGNPHRCSYCGRSEKLVNSLFQGLNSVICDECIEKIVRKIKYDARNTKKNLKRGGEL